MSVFLAVTPAEAASCRGYRVPLVHIAYAVGDGGRLLRSELPRGAQGGLLGLIVGDQERELEALGKRGVQVQGGGGALYHLDRAVHHLLHDIGLAAQHDKNSVKILIAARDRFIRIPYIAERLVMAILGMVLPLALL